MIDIIHAGAAHPGIAQGEAARLYYVDGKPETGGQTENGTGILWDIRLIQRYSHGQGPIADRRLGRLCNWFLGAV